MNNDTNSNKQEETIERIISRSYYSYIEKNEKNEIKDTVAEKNDESDSSDDNEEYKEHVFMLTIPENNIILRPDDEEKFWRIISTLAWSNSSENRMGLNDIRTNLDANEIKYIKDHIAYYASHVEDETSKLGWFTNSNIYEKKNFTYHVVALGYQYYLSAITDPTGFVQFIWDSNPQEYQNLYEFLHQI